jgi:hypothetical protein
MDFERWIPDMSRIVWHAEVPRHRTCVPDCNTVTQLVNATMCGKWHGATGKKRCFTCCAYKETKTSETFDVEKSPIVKFWVEFKATPAYNQATHHDKLSALARFLQNKPTERKALSKLGAMRRSRSEAVIFLDGKEPCCNYYTLMMSLAGTIGYVMFQDASNHTYWTWLDSFCKLGLNIEHTGDVVEAIMGLGFLYEQQRLRRLVHTDLDGIMELVGIMEDEVRAIQRLTAQPRQPVNTETEDEDSDNSSEAWGIWRG